MKTFLLTAILGALVASTAAVQAAEYITDPLLLELAQNGQIVTPHGVFSGR